MRRRRLDSERALYAAMSLAVAGFVGANLYAQYVVGRIHSSAQQIVLDAAPSIEHLAAARAEMHELERLVHDSVHGLATPEHLAHLHRVHERMQAELDAYVVLPASGAEEALLAQLRGEMATLRSTTEAALQRVQEGDGQAALTLIQGPLRTAVARTGEAILADIALHGQLVRGAAARIEGIRTHAARVSLVTNGLMVLLALVTTLLAGRVIRRYAEMMRREGAEQQARAAELEQFAGRVAHDVLSPLAPIVPALDALEDRLEPGRADDAQAARQLVRARSGLGHARRLVDALLEFAQAGALPDGQVASRLDLIVDDVLQELSDEAWGAGVALEQEPHEPVAVACTGPLMAVVVRNLVRNAIKYMGPAPERRVTVRMRAGVGHVRLEVEDTGPGLAPGLAPHVFGPFVRGSGADTPGSGLGLATVQRIVEAHAGRVGVQAAPPPGGCLFWLELPGAPLPAARPTAPARLQPSSAART